MYENKYNKNIGDNKLGSTSISTNDMDNRTKTRQIQFAGKIKYQCTPNQLNENTTQSQSGGGIKYQCIPTNNFDEICQKGDEMSKYKSMESCLNDCEGQYIQKQLARSHLAQETTLFYHFIKKLMNDMDFVVTARGGNIIGLKVLKMMSDRYKNDNDFEEHFKDFLELELIKDFDMASVKTGDPINLEFREKMDDIAKKFKLVNRAKTFLLYQTRKPILISGKALFEIGIMNPFTFLDLELPLTTMETRLDQYNLKYIFMIANMFYLYETKKQEINAKIIRRMLMRIYVDIHPCKAGLFDIKKSDLYFGNLSDEFITFIKSLEGINDNLIQFLAMLIVEPNRMFYRLIQKNVPKTDRIIRFIEKHKLSTKIPDWLIHTPKIRKLVDYFLDDMAKKMDNIYTKNKNSPIEAINKVIDFTKGINFDRIKNYWNDYNDEGIRMIKEWLEPLNKSIGKDIETIRINSKDLKDMRLVNCINFLYYKEVFDKI